MDIKLIISDMDGTIIKDGWNSLAELLMGKEGRGELYKKYINQPHLFGEWVKKTIAPLIGKDISFVTDQLFPLKYTPGFAEFCQYAQGRGIKIGIASAGVTLFSDEIKNRYNLDFAVANELITINGIFTGEAIIQVNLENKGEIAQQLMEQYDIPPEKTMHLGDYDNDIPTWQAVGHPLGMNFKKENLENLEKYVKAHFQSFLPVIDYLER